MAPLLVNAFQQRRQVTAPPRHLQVHPQRAPQVERTNIAGGRRLPPSRARHLQPRPYFHRPENHVQPRVHILGLVIRSRLLHFGRAQRLQRAHPLGDVATPQFPSSQVHQLLWSARFPRLPSRY